MKTALIVVGVIVLILIGAIGWAVGVNNQLVTAQPMAPIRIRTMKIGRAHV